MQLASAYSAGVLISNIFSLNFKATFAACAISSLLALITLLRKRLPIAGAALLTAMFYAGGTLASLDKNTTPHESLKQFLSNSLIEEGQSVTLTGILDGPPEFARDRVFLLLRVENVAKRGWNSKASGIVALLATFKTPTSRKEYRELNLHYGLRLRVRTALSHTDKFRNPGLSSLAEYLERKGYDATGLVKEPGAILPVEETRVFTPLAWLYRWRERVQLAIDERFSQETAGVLDAAILGNRYNLSKSAADRFREAGTFHVLVISGLHISFIGGIVLLFVRWLTRNRALQFLVSSLFVWAYAIAVGAEASVVRAALMFTFVTLGTVLFRKASALNALGGSALVLLVKTPRDLFDPSLQLTFLSVLAIVAVAWPLLQSFRAIGVWRPTRETPYPASCAPSLKWICETIFWSETKWKEDLVRAPHHYRLFKTPVAHWLERKHLQSPLRYIFNAIVVSVAVQIVLLPLLVVYFHRLSLASLILNICVSLLLAILSALSLAALLIAQLSLALAEPLVRLANGINAIMVHSVDPFAHVGLASVRIPAYSGWFGSIYFLYYLPVFLLIVALSRWRPLQRPVDTPQKAICTPVMAFLQILLIGTVVWHPFASARGDGKLHVDFLDVGQGDCALLTMPDATTVLVDAGGRPTFISAGQSDHAEDTASRSIGEMVVSEYLWWRGLDSVDYVVPTHADADHIDGLNDVVRNFSVRSALVGRTPANDDEYFKFSRSLTETRTPVETIQAGDRLRFGNVTANVLWPVGTNDKNAPSQNNDSIVLRVQFGERTILLTGDIEKEAEAKILALTKDLSADVVKVPHHGSRTSSTDDFVNATHPRLAIISVGHTSMFGHPHQEVVERWKKSGAEVLTTGNSGTISVTTDGKNLSVTKFVE
jgi:competence protein ComEC